MSDVQGRIVEILTFDNNGSSSAAIWWAAIDDDAAAVKAVSLAARSLADQGVRVTGRLSAQDILRHGLSAGQVLAARA